MPPPVLISKLKATLQGSFARRWAQRSAACDGPSGCAALAMTNAGNLWHSDADDVEKESERKTRCGYFSLMMLLYACWLKPKYLSHNSYLMLGRQHYCSAWGRVSAYLARGGSRVPLRDSPLWVSECHEAASHTGIAVFVKKLAANSYFVCS